MGTNAMIDKRSGSLSEEAFDYLLELESKRAVRYGYFLSLLLIEVDQPGNEEEVVQHIATLIRGQVRGTDLLGFSRMADLENRFRILLSYSDPAHARLIGERIRGRVEIHSFHIGNHDEVRTIRGGAACFPENSSDLGGMIKVAEEMLEQAKVSGGNRLVFP